MAIKLENKANVTAPGGAYSFGDVKDNTGAADGTPMDRAVMSDYLQFFAKMLDASAIVANGLLDNDTNGYQYFQALIKHIENTPLLPDSVKWNMVATPLTSLIVEAFAGSMTNELLRRTSGGATQMLGTCNRGLSSLPTTMGTISTTGSNNRPTTLTRCVCPSVDGSSTCVLEIDTDGTITMLSGGISTEYDMTGVMYISN